MYMLFAPDRLCSCTRFRQNNEPNIIPLHTFCEAGKIDRQDDARGFDFFRKENMVPIVTFIGWHNSGKTTLIQEVVRHLKQMNLRVAVIKSSKHSGIEFDRPGTDTDVFRQAGADAVTLMAPDQFVMMTAPQDDNVLTLIHRYFNQYDIVIGEGFKHERKIPKIEVTRRGFEPMADTVHRVIATVTDQPLTGENVFRPDESGKLAEFIARKFITEENKYAERALLFVNGRKIPMKGFVQDALAGTVKGFIQSLKQTGEVSQVELLIQYTGEDTPPEEESP